MDISLRELVEEAATNGIQPEDMTLLSQAAGIPAMAALARVTAAAVAKMRRRNEADPCLDLTRAKDHVLTVNGQIVGVQSPLNWIKEAADIRGEQQERPPL